VCLDEKGGAVRVFVVLALLVAGVLVVRSRHRVDVWHVAADQPS
jgi:hypothetical protein